LGFDPESAISTVTLQSGSNPVFGLDTLGAPWSYRQRADMTTQAPKWKPMAVLSGGARRGGDRREFGHFDYFLTGNYFDETGWRDLSPKASGFTDPRCGSPRQFRRPDLELGSVDLFHTVNSKRHTVHRNHDQPGLFRQCRQYAPQGVDLALGGKLARLRWHAVYSFVDATYQSNFLLNGESNSTADENGDIQVTSGNRIPLIPRHTGRLMLDYARRNSRRVLELARSTLRYLSAAKRTYAAR